MTTEVHSVRFYNLQPSEIKCLASDSDNDQLAVARSDNSIEIWNISSTPHVVRTIVDSYGTIEGLAWFEKRLFSVGLQGSILEYDLFRQTLKVVPSVSAEDDLMNIFYELEKNIEGEICKYVLALEPQSSTGPDGVGARNLRRSMHPLTSGAGWCVAVHKKNKQIAAGTEDGYINVFDIMDNELVYNRLLDKQEGRVQCLAWDPKGEFIATGSVDTVRVWNAETGHVVHRMTTGRSMNNVETRVWSVAFSEDLTVITGDSRGKLCIWDGQLGVSISSYQSHKADVLSVCLSKDEKTVYCAGVDPLIASYEKVKMRGSDGREKWVKSTHRFIHEHDVRSLVLVNGKLFSAGVDGYLAMSSFPPKMLVKYPPLLQSPAVYTATKAKCLLLRYPNYLVLWKLKGSEPTKLLEWYPTNNSKIRSAAISSDGKWLAVSTQDRFRLFSLKIKEKPKITKTNLKTKKNLASYAMCFSNDCSTLALASNDAKIHVIDLNDEPEIKHSYNPYTEKQLTDSISHLLLTDDGSYLITADLNCNIIVWSKEEVYCKLPKYSSPITAMNVQLSTNNLFIVHANHKIIEYSINKRKYTSFSKRIHDTLPAQWLTRSYPVHSITFDSRNNDVVMLGDDSTIMVVNKNKEIPASEAKIPRISSGDHEAPHADEYSENSSQHHPMSNSPTTAFHVIKKYKHLVHFGSLGDEEMVAVEISPVKLIEKLPSNFKQKKFGRM